MTKFNRPGVRTAPPRSVIHTTDGGKATYEGDAAFSRDAKSDLFLLSVTNMVGEGTFYESAVDRDDRFVRLVHQVTQEDPKWVADFARWLRGPDANMRSASLVLAAEYARAGGPTPRQVVSSVLQRPDEPGEFIGYWFSHYGKNLPAGVKRGLADAAVRLYNESAALKYDGTDSNAVRLGDVIELVHPRPAATWQAALFAYLLDRRHHAQSIRADLSALSKVTKARLLNEVPSEQRRVVLREQGAEALAEAGFTWERLGGWVPGGMDAEAWEAIIPSMGYMALLRNLRNFDGAGISAAARAQVEAVLVDPEAVAKSRQFPFRFWSAYKNTPSEKWSGALATALDLSCRNIPVLRGRTLVLFDMSGSMHGPLSQRSTVPRQEVGALFGVAQYLRAENADLVAFASYHKAVTLHKTTSVLRGVQEATHVGAALGGGTNTWPAIEAHLRPEHDRVVVFTDMQSPYYGGRAQVLRQVKRLYNWNLAGYDRANMETGKDGLYEFGGFSDASFRMIPLLEAGRSGDWPWA